MFVNILLEEMTEVQKTEVLYKYNQGSLLLANNNKVGIRTKHIDICDNFLKGMLEDKDMDIKYIRSEENPAYIMTKNGSDTYYAKHANWIMEGGL